MADLKSKNPYDDLLTRSEEAVPEILKNGKQSPTRFGKMKPKNDGASESSSPIPLRSSSISGTILKRHQAVSILYPVKKKATPIVNVMPCSMRWGESR